MNTQEVTVFYTWKANPGKLDQLKSMYEGVRKDMEESEPDALFMNCSYSKKSDGLFISAKYKDAGALGFHLQTTAAKHMPKLGEIANINAFYAIGIIPDELKAGILEAIPVAEFGTNLYAVEHELAH